MSVILRYQVVYVSLSVLFSKFGVYETIMWDIYTRSTFIKQMILVNINDLFA